MAVYGRQSGSGGSESGWFGYMRNLFQGQTGLSQLAWSPAIEFDFADGAQNTAVRGFQLSGTGAAATQQALPGGVIKVTGPTAAGYADWTNSGVGPYATVSNARTKRWMVATRVAVGTAPASASKVCLGILAAGGTFVGLGYVGAQTAWQYVRGSTPANIASTGKTIAVDSTGATGYVSMLLANFDLTSVTYNVDVTGGASQVAVEAVTNLPNGVVAPYFFNEGTAGDIYFLDKVCMYGEL